MRLPDPRRSHAVLIGTGDYRSPGLQDIPHVAGNLTALAQVLTSPTLGGLLPERCITLLDPADAVTVARTLRRYADATEDALLVYYAGHGQTTLDRGELFLGLPGTDEAELRLTALPFETIREAVGRSPAANRVVILDCCYSGHAIREHLSSADQVILNQIGIEGTYTLAAAPATSIALAPAGATYTAFTGMLLSLLRSGIPDGPELLALDDIYRHLLYAARNSALPQPQRRGTGTTDLLALTRNLAHPGTRTPPPPPTSDAQVRSPLGRRVLLSSVAAVTVAVGLIVGYFTWIFPGSTQPNPHSARHSPPVTRPWSHDFGSPVYSSPAVSNGLVVIGHEKTVYAFKADTGPSPGPARPTPTSTPAL